MNMSPKELLYIEDTLGHEKQISAVSTDSADKLTDPELKNFVMDIAKKHGEAFGTFYKLLG